MEKNQDKNKIVSNWDLIGSNDTEPHITPVGIGSWRLLKSNPYMIHRNVEQNKIRILDIGEVYDSARKLDANLAIDLSSDIKDIENMTEEQCQILTSNLGTKFFIDEWDANNLKNLFDEKTLSLRKHNGSIDENKNPKFTKENDELLRKTIDNYFMNRQLRELSETDKMAMARIYREARKYGVESYPVIKPFSEEKQIPTEREFKEEAKKLRVSGNFSSLGAAQNELAKRYGFKEYRAIKSKFSESSKSYDNIRSILINTSKLNIKENGEITTFIYKFRTIFRKLNISIGNLDFDMNKEPRVYYKILEQLEINENSLMEIYKYFLIENSIVFGQIKRNISILSQDTKINLLNDLNELEIGENDVPSFGLLSNLLAYHIGKSAGDVTLHKNEDGTIEQRFEER